jgi:hypothetical protein
MKNPELDKLLRSATPPNRGEEYWEDFPGEVTARIKRGDAATAEVLPAPKHNFRLLAGLGLGLATACIIAGFLIGFWRGREAGLDMRELALAKKYYQEVEALFPNQVQAIVFEQGGPRLILADKANVPRSTPFYLKICGPGGCHEVVTFSGQQIQVNGEKCDVLADGQGRILVVGKSRVWSETASPNPIRIEAKAIGTAL